MNSQQRIEQNDKVNSSQHDGVNCKSYHPNDMHIRWLIDRVRKNFIQNNRYHIDKDMVKILRNGKGAFKALINIHTSDIHEFALCSICEEFNSYNQELDNLETAIFTPKTKITRPSAEFYYRRYYYGYSGSKIEEKSKFVPKHSNVRVSKFVPKHSNVRVSKFVPKHSNVRVSKFALKHSNVEGSFHDVKLAYRLKRYNSKRDISGNFKLGRKNEINPLLAQDRKNKALKEKRDREEEMEKNIKKANSKRRNEIKGNPNKSGSFSTLEDWRDKTH